MLLFQRLGIRVKGFKNQCASAALPWNSLNGVDICFAICTQTALRSGKYLCWKKV